MKHRIRKFLSIAVLICCAQTFAQAQKQTAGIYPFETVEQPLTPEVELLLERLRLAEAEIESLKNAGSIHTTAWQPASQPSGFSSAPAGDGDVVDNDGSGDLASKSQNPVSDLAALPFQTNYNFGSGTDNRTGFVGNLQPVVPVTLGEDWNLVSRFILPMVNAPIGSIERSDGLGDSLLQFYLSPRDSGDLIWGIGPNFLLPTASDSTLGAQEWGAGVNGVVLVKKQSILTGSLVSQTWSVGGSTAPFLVQPFFNYNMPEGWFFSASGDINADWSVPQERRWSIPMGAGIGRVFPILGQPVSISTRFAPYLEKPPGGPDWQFRLSVTYLFPK